MGVVGAHVMVPLLLYVVYTCGVYLQLKSWLCGGGSALLELSFWLATVVVASFVSTQLVRTTPALFPCRLHPLLFLFSDKIMTNKSTDGTLPQKNRKNRYAAGRGDDHRSF